MKQKYDEIMLTMVGSKIPIKKFCEHCGEKFIVKVSTKFCSYTCANRAYKQRKREERVQIAEKTAKEKAQSNVAEIVDRPSLSRRSRVTPWIFSANKLPIHCSFGDLTVELCQNFREYLLNGIN